METEHTQRVKRGLASASEETRLRVARKGGVSPHHTRRSRMEQTMKLGLEWRKLEVRQEEHKKQKGGGTQRCRKKRRGNSKSGIRY